MKEKRELTALEEAIISQNDVWVEDFPEIDADEFKVNNGSQEYNNWFSEPEATDLPSLRFPIFLRFREDL